MMTATQKRWNQLGRVLDRYNPMLFHALLHLVEIVTTTALDVLIVDDDALDTAPAEGS